MIYFQVNLKAKSLSILPITCSEQKYVFINFLDNIENAFLFKGKKLRYCLLYSYLCYKIQIGNYCITLSLIDPLQIILFLDHAIIVKTFALPLCLLFFSILKIALSPPPPAQKNEATYHIIVVTGCCFCSITRLRYSAVDVLCRIW